MTKKPTTSKDAADKVVIRVGGRWRYLWRTVDAHGQMVDFRLPAKRDAKAAKAFLNNAIKRVRLHRPVTIVTDKAQAYPPVAADRCDIAVTGRRIFGNIGTQDRIFGRWDRDLNCRTEPSG
ncbi:MAG: DDE-type integrase/transposase/recombinase [Pseudoruegeria sp.]